jgi:hypothetical protein
MARLLSEAFDRSRQFSKEPADVGR